MLTGDRKNVADYVAKDLGIQEVYSELLPGDKVSKVEELLDRKTEKKNWHSSVMESTMHRYFPEPISELPWVPWDLMQRLRRPISY